MNYLAHALLSPADPMILLGNLWGDLLKPRDYPLLPPGMRTGVDMHKAIDAFTDHHHSVDQMMKILRPYQGKYTPVVTDVLMDYMLSKYWHEYNPEPLEVFCQRQYGIVRANLHVLPERLHSRITRMLSHQWLESCKSRDRMENTLLMLSRRASFENNIRETMIPYDLHEAEMDRNFEVFFNDVRQYITLQNAG